MRFWQLSLLFLSLILPPPLFAEPMSACEVARAEAEAYLDLLDRERYAEAWDVSSPYLRARMTQRQWQRILKGYRERLGRVSARQLVSIRFQDQFESAPPGVYLRIDFRSTFGRVERLEQLVVGKDDDGRWRVGAYQLR